jgi:hypothetical protein
MAFKKEIFKIEKKPRKKYKPISDYFLGWGIQPVQARKGKILYYLNKFHQGRTTGHIICNKKQLLNLKRFMQERTIK